MTLPANLTMQQVNTELGRAAGFAWNMNDDISARQLAQVSLTPGIPWQLSSLAGKSCYPMTMVVGKDPSINTWGFDDGSSSGATFGSLNPRLLSGQTVTRISGDVSVTITIVGLLPKDYWTTLEFKDNINGAAYTRFYSSQAVFYQTNPVSNKTDWGFFSSGNAGLQARMGATVYALFMK